MDTSTRFNEWIVRAEYSADTANLELEAYHCPARVGGHRTPSNLDDMTLGQMVQLSGLKSGREMFYACCNVLLGMSKEEVDKAYAVEVVRFVGWVLGKVKTINALFDKVKSQPTQREVQAGVERLQFGIFGMVDWYAKRMGISDHEEVMSVSWVRIYKCLDMDNRKNEYEKQLAKIIADEYRK